MKNPKPLRLRVGAWYQDAGGHVHRIIKRLPYVYEFMADDNSFYDQAGARLMGNEHSTLIREVTVAPAAARKTGRGRA